MVRPIKWRVKGKEHSLWTCRLCNDEVGGIGHRFPYGWIVMVHEGFEESPVCLNCLNRLRTHIHTENLIKGC